MAWVKRSCTICEASCGLRIQIDRSRRKIQRVEGDPDDVRSRGFVCPKSQAMKAVYNDPDRLRQPLQKTAAGWREIDWDTAFAETAQRLLETRERYGFEALGTYIGNPTGFDVGAMMYIPHLIQALMTPHVFTAATMDHFPKMVSSKALYGKGTILPVPDIDRCDYFLCLGANPVVSQGSLMSAPAIGKRLRALQERGGKLVVIDPRRTETAQIADEHLFIRPGTDAYLLSALLQVAFEESLIDPRHLADHLDGIEELERQVVSFTPETVADITNIEAGTIRRLAREYAQSQHGVCYGRVGTCTVRYGTLTSYLIDALGIVTGHFDRPGGMMFPRSATGEQEAGAPLPEFEIGRWHSAARGFPEIDGQMPAAALAEEIDAAGDRRIRALLTVAGNPVLSTPNGTRLERALESLDFMVAVDFYLNETTRHADIILPPVTTLEMEGLDALSAGTAVHNFARYSPAVIEAPQDGKLQWEILLELAARLQGTSTQSLERTILEKQTKRYLKRPDSPAHGLSVEEAIGQLDDRPGPMRLVDMMLRAGPYGDGFDEHRQGLSLRKLRNANTPIALGDLQPRLLELLRTPKRRINLAHPYLLQDFQALRGDPAVADEHYPFLLIGRRQVQNMNTWLHNVPQLAKGRPRCTLLINREDAAGLGINDGQAVRLASRVGEIEVPAEISDAVMAGVVSLPHGFGHCVDDTRLHVAAAKQPGANVNAITDEQPLDPLSGTGIANAIPVRVQPG